MKHIAILILVLVRLATCFSQEKNSYDINSLHINWELIGNKYHNEDKSLSNFKLLNTGKIDFPASGWTIYFNNNRKITLINSTTDFSIQHLNGDLSQIKPTPNFQGLKQNQSVDLSILSGGKILNPSYTPSGIYIVWDQKPEKGFLIKNYFPNPIIDTSIAFINAETTYNNNKNTAIIPTEKLPKIFPTVTYYKENKGFFILDKKTSIRSDASFLKEASYFSEEINTLIGSPITINPTQINGKTIIFKKLALAKEEYILNIQSDKIEISAATGSGIFYGIQSLKSLLSPNYWKNKSPEIAIQNCYVKDKPRFEYRGFMLDVARNFQTKETIFKVLDLMSLYKMNRFHFHFSDDEGWRIEIKSIPELTEIGSKRGHTLDSNLFLPPAYGSGPDTNASVGSGFYTKNDFIEILKYATERHIQVIPEIESPGHSRAAIKAMESRYKKYMLEGNTQEAEKFLLSDLNDKSVHSSAQLWTDNVMCVALPSTYTFLEKVIDDLLSMYKEANAPIETIHLGGDEVPNGTWELSPICKQLIATNLQLKTTDDLWYYYFDKMNTILKKRNLALSGWEEIAMRKTILDGKKGYIPNPDFANQGFRAHVWNNGIGWGSEDLPYKLANSGYKVILSCVSNLYFDLAYEKAPDEAGYYWAGYNNIDKIFKFIPLDYYKNTKENAAGNPIESSLFNEKVRLTDFGKSNILGIQGQLFSENIRNTDFLEYLLVPKLIALSERAWAQNPSWATEKNPIKSAELYDKSWSVFVNVLGKRELVRLNYYAGGFNYRIPPVGARIENKTVVANIQIPGFVIRYTTNGTIPTINSSEYKKPIEEKGQIFLCAFTENGRHGKLTVIENKEK